MEKEQETTAKPEIEYPTRRGGAISRIAKNAVLT